MARVEIGDISETDVEFLALNPLQTTGFDLILGQSILRLMRLNIDFASGSLRLTKTADAP